MKEKLERLVRDIAQHPEAVRATQAIVGTCTVVEISVHPDDMPHVLGRRHETKRAIRQYAYALGGKEGQRVHVEIVSLRERRG